MKYNILLIVLICLVLFQNSFVFSRRLSSPIPYYSKHNRNLVNDPPPPPYNLIWYNQTLDHFNFETQEYFQQRVLIYDGNFNTPNSDLCSTPMIFFCGNEGDITYFYQNSQFVTNILSQELNALIVFAEHRYYGQTLPFGNSSYTNDNLQYLTSEQALADFAEIIPFLLKSYIAQHCPVFTTSGSYGGDLAAWMRLKYPDIVDGALAASAPLLYYIGTGVPYDTFAISNTKNFEETSSEGTCAEKIRTAFKDLQNIAQQTDGYSILTQEFRLCYPITNESDFENFLGWVEAGFNYIGMADYPYPASFLEPMPGYPVNYTCNLISTSQNSIQVIYSALSVYYNYTGQMSECFNTNVFIEDNDITIPWGYQSCTEVVTPWSMTGINDMYWSSPFDLEEYIQDCQEEYGVTPDPNWITTYYGGTELFPSSNIIFSNGILDPWHRGGINVTQTSENIIAILIPGAAHHLDLRMPNPLDPPSVTEARALEIKYLSQWSLEASLLKSKK